MYLINEKGMNFVIRTAQKIKMIKTGEIIPNPYQIRRKFPQKEIEMLAESLKEVGMISPVIVRRGTSGFELVCGQRRLRAAVIAGMREVPAIIVRAGDAQCAELSIIENIHRNNLSVFEEAEGFYNLIVYHKIKKDRLQKDLSVDPFILNDRIRMLALKEDVRKTVERANLEEESIKELLRLHNEEKQLEIAERAEKEKLSFNQIRVLTNEILNRMTKRTVKDKKTVKFSGHLLNKGPLYINTVKKTVELLKKNGARVEYSQKEDEEWTEFVIKAYK